ncbi:hypothetical protein BGX34_004388, partial [Mortierella sp. NVP85]
MLKLANIYLENAFDTNDPDIALVLCDDTEASLDQVKKSAKQDKDQTLTEGITMAYIGLAKLLESLQHFKEAQASFKKAEKLGGNLRDLTLPTDTYRPSSIRDTLHSAGFQEMGSEKSSLYDQLPGDPRLVSTVRADIFDKNIGPPTIQAKLPEPDTRLDSTLQLVYCLELLKIPSSDIKLEPIALKWMKTIEKNKDEQERLYGIAMDVIRAFKREGIKDAKAVAEVVLLSSILDKDAFRDLLKEFYSAIDHPGLLNIQQLEGLARLIEGADYGYLCADDLVKILEILSIRLRGTHKQSPEHIYLITLAVSRVLDAMADTRVTDLDRDKLHEPLSSYLIGLKKSSDLFLVYQAAYAYQALLWVPDDKSTWQAAIRRAGKRDWYSALRGADTLIRDGQLATFKELVCKVPCQADPVFQWGVCQRLGEIANNSAWDADTRRDAIKFLGEIYKNDEMWGQQASVKQWILNILMQLSSLSEGSSNLISAAAETLLKELKASGGTKKQELYRMSLMNGPTAYPLKVAMPEPGSPSLLDR